MSDLIVAIPLMGLTGYVLYNHYLSLKDVTMIYFTAITASYATFSILEKIFGHP